MEPTTLTITLSPVRDGGYFINIRTVGIFTEECWALHGERANTVADVLLILDQVVREHAAAQEPFLGVGAPEPH